MTVDLDGDGDLDILGGNSQGTLLYWKNVGSPTAPAFATVTTNPFGLTGVPSRAAPVAVDLDGDGALDVVVGASNGTTYFFKNVGSPTSPSFAATVQNAFGLTDIGSDAVPVFVDIDGDGDLDAFVGKQSGDISFFQNVGTPTAPQFAPAVTNPFGLQAVGQEAAPRFADLDGDGDLDAWIGDVTGAVQYFENTGTPTAPAFAAPIASAFGLKKAAANAVPTFGDLDGDGDLDLLVGTNNATFYYFKNIGSPSAPAFDSSFLDPFGLQTNATASRPALGDLDGDGDLDVLVGDGVGDSLYFQNVGTADAPAFAAPVPNPFGLSSVGQLATPVLADLDGDGDLDAWIDDSQGNISYFENVGTPSAPAFAAPVQNPFGIVKVQIGAAPTFADIDGDGDLDAFIGTGTGNVRYFENVGIPTAPTFAPGVTNPFGLVNLGGDARPQFIDVDLDGDLDAFVSDANGNVQFFENVGDANTPVFAAAVQNPFGLANVGRFAAPTFADIDNDGDLDGLFGNIYGEVLLFRASRSLTCDQAARSRCWQFTAGSFLVNETKPGKEQLSAQLKSGPALTQADFGDPEHSHNAGYAFCLYDDDHALAGQLVVDRGAALCGGRPCWKNVGGAAPGGKGYAYKDSLASSDGVAQIALHAGAAGKSSALLKARNNAAKGQTALPTGIADALFSSGTVTMQIQKARGTSCYGATLSNTKRHPGYLKAK